MRQTLLLLLILPCAAWECIPTANSGEDSNGNCLTTEAALVDAVHALCDSCASPDGWVRFRG